MDTFSAQACIRFGWETFKRRPWFLIGAFLLYMIVLGLISAVASEIGKVGPAVNFVASFANWGVQIIGGMGMIAFLLKAHDDIAHVALQDFWHPQPFLYYLGACILMFLAFLGGLILLIVPGIIFAIMFSFATYLVIDRGLSPMQAMRERKRITDGHKGTLFSLALLSVGVALLGLLCLIVGLFVANPVISLAGVHAYRVLQKQTVDISTSAAA